MSEAEQIISKLDQLIELLAESRPLGETMDTHDIARFLKVSYSQARDRVIVRPDFPKPIRATNTGNPRKVFFTSDVIAWSKRQQK